jgi:Fic family protein
MKTPKLQITTEILNLIAAIDEFKGRWDALKQMTPDRLQSLRHIATIESVGSSTRIEGVKLSDREVEQLLQGLDTRSFRSRDEEEVAGYADAMALVFEAFQDIPLTENHIKQLHQTLLKHATKDVYHRGEYKKFTNHVEAFGADGKSLGVVFETVSPFDTPQCMTDLIAWTNQAFEAKTLHPLLVIGIFIVHFLAIHPFQDGNGRLSRVLTTLLLMQQGYAYVPYSSLERIVEENKDAYYLSLRQAQGTLNKDDAQLNKWLGFFLTCLQKQGQVLAGKIEREALMKQLPALSEEILKIAREHGRITVSDAVEVTQANRNTIKARIRDLVADGYLTPKGQGKSTWYTVT